MIGKLQPQNREWLVPAALLFLSLVPALAGAARLMQLSSGTEITPENARFFAAPLPVVLHILGATLFSLLGAFQFAPRFRRRNLRWHRAAGKWLIPSGLVTSLSGLWMTLFYPWPAMDGPALYLLRLFFGGAMTLCLLLGSWAIYRRKFSPHGAWMLRAYAIGLGAGTQVFTHLPLALFPDALNEHTRALAMGAGWVINLAIAEWILLRRLVPPKAPKP